MRVSHWWCALLVLGSSHLAHAEEAAVDDAPSMEVIEMLGEMEGDGVDLEIAMSDEKVDEQSAAREVKDEN